MTTTRSPSLREKVRQLRRVFLDKLPDSLTEARRHLETLCQTPDDDDALEALCRLFHGVKGTAASFGLPRLSATAAQMETTLRLARDGDPGDGPSSRRERLTALLLALPALLDGFAQGIEDARRHPEALGVAPPAPDFERFSVVPRKDRKRIYVCDDEELQAEQLSAQLRCFGYAVSIFTTPESLRAAVLSVRPDAVVMDIIFPSGSSLGTDLIAGLRRDMRAPPPVVFVSSRRDFDARLRAVQAGGEAYFAKPIKAIDLVECLDGLTLSQEPDPYRVLVVDDEPEIATYHSFILEQVGMTTRLLHDPRQILETLNEFNPDLVLMDMYMPTCTGRDLSRLIRQVPEFISLPIVFLSSETDKVKQVSALRVGAEGFLTKPIQPEDLISAVALRAERMRTLRSLMVRDSLTGLFNHTFMLQFLESAISSARRDETKLCLVMIDVDRFKMVNDSYGHPVGDQVLVALARLFQQRLRTSDTVGRYGGEEFAVILQNVAPTDAKALIDDLRGDFAKIRFDTAGQEFNCTFSAGVAGFSGQETAHLLLERADRALYDAKREGRNRVLIAEDEHHDTMR
ncbi:diguanylate cyclase [Pararhodospirillum photometricum]|nr:diguanylate cyclase [Pararhodospirillum photometricum]